VDATLVHIRAIAARDAPATVFLHRNDGGVERIES
jgi:hypothetical protein